MAAILTYLPGRTAPAAPGRDIVFHVERPGHDGGGGDGTESRPGGDLATAVEQLL